MTKANALQVIRRASGPDRAESAAGRRLGRIDLDDAAHPRPLAEFGLTGDGRFHEFGAEL
jgi:hypothetical protein